MISNERLKEIVAALCTDSLHDYEQVFNSIKNGEIGNMAKELLALRKAFSEPAAYEVKGLLCHTIEEADIYVGEPEPLYRGPE